MMFERSKVDSGPLDTGAAGVSVVLSLADGSELKGRLAIPQGRTFGDVINGTAPFVEFEEFDGPRQYLAKHAISGVRLINPGRGQGLPRMRDVDAFDPHAILGVALGAPYEDLRAAYVRKAKAYHPDRYANADLPEEVRTYLEAMARRVNAAFSALDTPPHQKLQEIRPRAVQKMAPVYSSPAR